MTNPIVPVAATNGVTAPAGTGLPWVDGRLPSPWASPPAGPGPGAAASFAQIVEQTSAAAQAAMGGQGSGPGLAAASRIGGLSEYFGMPSIEALGKRLSQGQAEMARSMAALAQLDPTAPDLPAQFLSVSLMSAKSSVSDTIALKFASKVNENINTLMKSN